MTSAWLHVDDSAESARALSATFTDNLHGLLGMTCDEVTAGRCAIRLDVGPRHFAGNGFLHAATLIALADSAAGFGCMASLPETAKGFTTLELKSNFVGTVISGEIVAVATLAHGGRTTQIWDAIVTSAIGAPNGKSLAIFRCTQLVLY